MVFITHSGNSFSSFYGESLSYDKNGNIQTLTRYGNREATDYAQLIDELEYTYHPEKKNQLMQVYDSTLEPVGFSDGSNGNNPDYAYDDFGNMTGDGNKGIDLISYNHLNLPVKMAFSNGARIEYLYRADGTKVQKKVFFLAPALAGGLGSSAMDYLGGFQYQDNVLKHFATAEGYVSHVSGSYQYVYNYTDHLGNARLSYGWDMAEAKLKIMEENHYYPFGMKHANYNTHTLSAMKKEESNEMTLKVAAAPSTPKPVMGYNYKYNGKEFQDEMGLNMYDYGARNYDPAIGRWMNIDPLAEDYVNISPYAYTANSPVIFLDPNGKEIYLYYTTEGNSKKDDEMFWSAAMTRAFDFLSNKNFEGNDIFKVTRVKDLASIKNDAESFISENSKKYGKTKEVGIWSHAGLDGPVGTVATSKNALSIMENKQMSLEGWGNIDFNWAKDASAYFYGCLTGLDPSGDKRAFTTELSALSNFKDVTVYGQTNYSYPSQYANSRRPTGDQLDGNFSPQVLLTW